MTLYTEVAIKAQHKLNKQNPPKTLPKAFSDAFPDMKPAKAQKLFEKYLDRVGRVIIPLLPYSDEDHVYVSMKEMFDTCGDFKHKGTRYYLWNAFKDIYPIVTTTILGSNIDPRRVGYERNTKAKIVDHELIKALVEAQDDRTAFGSAYGIADPDNEPPFAKQTAIDMNNLAAYISRTEESILTAQQSPLRDKLRRNLYQALLVAKIGRWTTNKYGNPFLPAIEQPSDFGRIYLKGLSVQNVSKEVRSALLGRHFQYDLNAASYAVKLLQIILDRLAEDEETPLSDEFNKMVAEGLYPYTRDYLANKQDIRTRLSETCFKGTSVQPASALKSIKLAITALGFGAKASSSAWMTPNGWQGSSISEIIKNKDARDAFLSDPWVKEFAAEQRQIEAAILANFAQTTGYKDACDVVAKNNKTNGKVAISGLMTYLYQQMESGIMKFATDILKANGIEVAANIHDAFITYEKLPDSVLEEIYAAWGNLPFLTLDCDEVQEWKPKSAAQVYREADKLHADHKSFIEQEEQAAQLIAMKRAQAQIVDDKMGVVIPIQRTVFDLEAVKASMIRIESYYHRDAD